jgi:hypothetical protein
VTLGGSKIEFHPDSSVVVYSNNGVQIKPVHGEAVDLKGNQQFNIGKDFNSVAVYGAKVELATDGRLVVTTNGGVTVKPTAANDRPATTKLEVGQEMPDGTIYGGVSPDDGKPMFVVAKDSSSSMMTFNEAAKFASSLMVHGHNDYRVLTRSELYVLYQNKDKGALKNTFNNSHYWSSSEQDYICAWYQSFIEDFQDFDFKLLGFGARCVRSGSSFDH